MRLRADGGQARAWRRGALSAGLFATAWLCGTFWWLFISMHTYGGLAAPLAAWRCSALAAALALYYALACALYVALAPEHRGGARAALRRALDPGRTAAQQPVHRLSLGRRRLCARRRAAGGYAPWLGVYGIGAMAALIAALVAQPRCSTCEALVHGWSPGALAWLLVCGGVARIAWSPAARQRHRPTPPVARPHHAGAAAGQHPAGREVHSRRRHRDRAAAGTASNCSDATRAAGDHARNRDAAAAFAVAARLSGRHRRALCQRQPGGHRRPAAGRRQELHQHGARLTPGPGATLPLRQAPPGALRRVHAVHVPLVHRHDEHPAGRLPQRRPGAAALRLAGPAHRAQHLLRGLVRRRDRRQLSRRGACAHGAAQREQHRLVRRLDRDRPAPGHFAHACPRVRATDGARHQHRRHSGHRPPRPRHPRIAAPDARRADGRGRRPHRPHALCALGLAVRPRRRCGSARCRSWRQRWRPSSGGSDWPVAQLPRVEQAQRQTNRSAESRLPVPS